MLGGTRRCYRRRGPFHPLLIVVSPEGCRKWSHVVRNSPLGLPISWVPLVFLPPQVLGCQVILSRLHPLGKGRGSGIIVEVVVVGSQGPHPSTEGIGTWVGDCVHLGLVVFIEVVMVAMIARPGRQGC